MCIYCNSLCSNIFWQIFEQKPFYYVFSVKMEITTGLRRVLVLSFLMIGVSICLPNIRKGEKQGFHQQSWGSSLSEDKRHRSPVSCMTLWLWRWSLITIVDIFSEASHWGIPGRSPSPDAKRSAHFPGADVEWVTNSMISPLPSSNSSMSSSYR